MNETLNRGEIRGRPFAEINSILNYFEHKKNLMGENQEIYLKYLEKIRRRMGFFKLKNVREGKYSLIPLINRHPQEIIISKNSISWSLNNDGGKNLPPMKRIISFSIEENAIKMRLTKLTFENRSSQIPSSTKIITIGNNENASVFDGTTEITLPTDKALIDFPEPKE